ncbi:MAG: DUF255 domain-containing protein [Fimbriimonadaceae bacterium]|nr:DUF255 domain-containing protein [Fimbriimonadaceae bacterium]QYK57946.1 MAG: DUF255 domain-containing protein [Fimbriimonadaceae bacterium]
MPVWGRRESYPMVVATMAVLTGVFALTAVCRPLIPPPDENDMAYAPGDFVRSASRQSVRWRTLAADPFLEARRLDRPLLLAIGSAGSWVSRSADKQVFSEPEVAERLNREFVCVRIDTDLNPEWTRAVVPVTSVNEGADPGWSVVLAAPSGNPLVWMARTNSRSGLDAPALLAALLECRRQIVLNEPRLATIAERDRLILLDPPESVGLTLQEYVLRLAARASREFGGFPENGVQRWHPWEWRLLLLGGLKDDVARNVDPLLKGPLVNWIDGGLFSSCDRPDGGVVKFDSAATINSDMASVLAWLSVRSGDPWHRVHAERLIDAVLDEFVTSDGLYAARFLNSIEGDSDRRYGMQPRSALGRVSPQDRGFIDRLGLRDPKNESQVPFVSDPGHYLANREAYDRVFAAFKKTAREPRARSGKDYLHVTGAVVARLIEAARWLGDKPRLRRALALLPLVRVYEVGTDDVRHSIDDAGGGVTLGDYTSYADAMLQGYLATGDESALRRGRATLDRARFLFFDTDLKVALNGLQREGDISSPWTALPQLADTEQEATTAAFVRLSAMYAQLDPSPLDRTKEAREVVATATRSAKSFEFRVGGLYHAIGLLMADFSVAVVGQQAVDDASALAHLAPGVTVFPSSPTCRPDLKNPGVYFLRAGRADGPVSLDQARLRLSSAP